MLAKRQLTVVVIAALMVSVSLFYGVEPSMGAPSDGSLKNIQTNASHAETSDDENLSTVLVGNASTSSIHATDPLGVSGDSSMPANAVTAAFTPTTTTITTSNAKPAVSQSFTLSGTLNSGTTPLSGRTITLGRTDPSGHWSSAGTTTTATNGTYTFTRSESAQGVYWYQAVFAGDTTYGPSNASVSLTVGTLTPTTLTITTSNTKPAVSQSFTLSGTLKSGTTPLSGRTITLGRTDPSGHWSSAGTTTTATNGTYTFTRSESAQGVYWYQAVFAGDTTYGPSNASVSLDVGNLQKSAISIFATNYTPAVDQTYTLYGLLQHGVNGMPLAGQPISLTIRCPSGQNVYMSTTTATNGTYTFTRSESAPGTYHCTVGFRGNSSYAESGSMLAVIVGNPKHATLSLNITNNNPDVNQPFTISGYLTDINGTKLSGRVLSVVARLPTGAWASREEVATDSNGYYSATISEETSGQYRYEVTFWGDSTYASVTNGVQVAVGTLQPTKISANTNVTNPGVHKSYTLFGNLTDANGKPLSGKEIDLFQNVVGVPTQRGNIVAIKYTDQNGYYFFVLNESTSGNYIYTAWFMGDQTYANSLASVSLTVGTLTPTTLTITTSNTKPAVSQSFTLSGTLNSGTTPLSGRTITLGRTDPSGHWSSAGTTTTATNGTYTFTRSESAQGVYWYQAVFAGDTTYGPSNASVSLTVGTLTPTTTTITATTTTPTVGQPVTFTATLKSGTTPLSNKPVTIYHYLRNVRSNDTTKTTNANGQITFTQSFGSAAQRPYYATFAGDSSYQTSTSSVITIDVRKL
jgi:hypothetical protein